MNAYTPAHPPVMRTPHFWWSGTGGLETLNLVRDHFGYETPTIRLETVHTAGPYAELMQVVKDGFGRTVSRLPEIFGVSRQTLYNWMKGETPKVAHHDKLRELAAAARVFSAARFKPTSATLEKTLAHGKSFVELLSHGAPGAQTAERLVRLARRGTEERSRLDALLGPRKTPKPEVTDLGSPSLAED